MLGVDFDNAEFSEVRILELYHKLYKYIAQEFRHVGDCSACHATLQGNAGLPIISKNAEPAIRSVALGQIEVHNAASMAFSTLVETAKISAKQTVKPGL